MLAAMRATPPGAGGGDATPPAALLHPLATAAQPVVLEFDAAPSAPAASAASAVASPPSAPSRPAPPSDPAAPSPPPAVDEATLESLMQLGYEEAACRAALARHGGDEKRAADWLLSN